MAVKKTPKPLVQEKYLWIGGGVLLVLAIAFLLGKYLGKNPKTEEREIDVKVNIQDQNGNTVPYDPEPLLRKLNYGLTTRFYFDFSERCNPIKELYNLDAARFMATIKAYKTKYNEELQTHMRATWVDCNTGTGGGENYFDLIYQRIVALQDIIK